MTFVLPGQQESLVEQDEGAVGLFVEVLALIAALFCFAHVPEVFSSTVRFSQGSTAPTDLDNLDLAKRFGSDRVWRQHTLVCRFFCPPPSDFFHCRMLVQTADAFQLEVALHCCLEVSFFQILHATFLHRVTK